MSFFKDSIHWLLYTVYIYIYAGALPIDIIYLLLVYSHS